MLLLFLSTYVFLTITWIDLVSLLAGLSKFVPPLKNVYYSFNSPFFPRLLALFIFCLNFVGLELTRQLSKYCLNKCSEFRERRRCRITPQFPYVSEAELGRAYKGC